MPVAARGTEAIMMMLGRTAGTAYPLAIIDQVMPGMDGLALAYAIRNEPSLATTAPDYVNRLDQRARPRGLTSRL